MALTPPPRYSRTQSRFETPTRLHITITSKWSSQLRRAYISGGSLWDPPRSRTHSHRLSRSGNDAQPRAGPAHVRYCTTRNMTTQVSSIPPIIKYLPWKARFSMSRITVLDKPSMLAMSRIFFWVPWGRQAEKEKQRSARLAKEWDLTNRQSPGHA